MKGITIEIKPFRSTFIVGKSGSGKSTLSNILLQLYDIDSGAVYIDNMRLDTLSPKWLFENIHVVEQQGALFDFSAEENIRMGSELRNSNVPSWEIGEACLASNFDEVIQSLPSGLQSKVGICGSKLSGGQKQRLLLARAFIADAPIMIFDESVTALDIQRRNQLIKIIRRLRRGKTTLFITHELPQIESDDYVYLMKDGAVVEHGQRNFLESVSTGYFNTLLQATVVGGSEESPTESTVPFLTEVPQTRRQMMRPLNSRTSNARLSPLFGPSSLIYGSFDNGHTEELDDENLTPTSKMDIRSIFGLQHPMNREDSERSPKHKDSEQLSTAKVIGKIFKSIPDKKTLTIGLSIAILNGFSNPIFSYAFSNLFTNIVSNSTSGELGALQWAMAVLGIGVLDGITTYLQLILHITAERWLIKLRWQAFESITERRMIWFDQGRSEERKSSVLTNLIMNDAENLRTIVTRFFSSIVKIVALTTCALIWAFISGWKLTLVGLSMAPGFYVTSKWYRSVIEKWDRIYHDHLSGTIDLMSETVVGIKTVKTLSLERYFLEKYQERSKTSKKIMFRKAVYTGFGYGISRLFTFITEGLLLWYGMRLVSTGEYQAHQAMLVFILLVFSLVTADQLSSSILQLNNAFDVFVKLNKIINEDQQTVPSFNPRIRICDGRIKFKKVCFSYGTKSPVINNLSLKINKAEVVALVGPSGCGKSTITKLLTGLYQPQLGTISIDGYDLSDISPNYLRTVITVVHQMPVQFRKDTIADNLRYAMFPRLSPQDESSNTIEQAMRLACAQCGIDKFIDNLPDGYNTYIESSKLSGGQLQRLAIARALVRRPKILILDECTSALDLESIAVIQSLVLSIKQQGLMTLVIITHQQEMMDIADRIIEI